MQFTFRFGAKRSNLTHAVRATGFPSFLPFFFIRLRPTNEHFQLKAPTTVGCGRNSERESWTRISDSSRPSLPLIQVSQRLKPNAFYLTCHLQSASVKSCLTQLGGAPALQCGAMRCRIAESPDHRSRCESGSAETLRMREDTSRPSKLWMTHDICLSNR